MSLDTCVNTHIFGDLHPAKAAVFLDFDGVLVDIAEHPDAVVVNPEVVSLLAIMESLSNGALAIVTGRDVEDLRQHLPIIPQAVIGSHGADRQIPGTASSEPACDKKNLSAMQSRAARAGIQPGVFVERKRFGAAIHYRNALASEDLIRELCTSIAVEFPGFEVMPAKCAFELRPAGIGKDKAVADAMERAPFVGRVPVYIGDDVTDEPALAWVAAQGGIAIKVGEGPTVAPHRVANPAEVQAALADWLKQTGGLL